MRDFEDAMLDLIDRNDQRERMLKALRQLPPIQQITIILLWLGYQPHEIAAVGGRHPNGLRYHKDAFKRVLVRMGGRV